MRKQTKSFHIWRARLPFGFFDFIFLEMALKNLLSGPRCRKRMNLPRSFARPFRIAPATLKASMVARSLRSGTGGRTTRTSGPFGTASTTELGMRTGSLQLKQFRRGVRRGSPLFRR